MTSICVYGLWHLGSVTAACLAQHFDVVGVDPQPEVVTALNAGRPPIAEPGLADLLDAGRAAKRLRFTTDLSDGLRHAETVWVTFDTPVDDDDRGDVELVCTQVERLFPHLRAGMLVVLSSQLPVGTTRRLERRLPAHLTDSVHFAYSPENLRLGRAIETFTAPDRIVVGVRHTNDRARLADLLKPFTTRIEWMGIESAEMTKHAINTYFAASVALVNEIAILCERVGACAKDVERGLRSEARIGPRAYVAPGAAFSGGTLARDVEALSALAAVGAVPISLIPAVRASNEAHKTWPCRRLRELLGDLRGRTIGVLGLTYKPDTDTLRRSGAVEICRWLCQQGATVSAYDPAISALPHDLRDIIALRTSIEAAIDRADAIVVATGWPQFKSITADLIVARARSPLVLDADHLLAASLGTDPRIRYVAVGRAG